MEACWLDLLNSDWRDHVGSGRREDRIGKPEWLDAFLRKWHLPRSLARPAGREGLRSLRATLRPLVELLAAGAHAGKSELSGLNAVLSATPVRRRIAAQADRYALLFTTEGGSLEAALASIAADFAAFLSEADPSRLRLCANRDCSWVFVDSSPGRTRRWCEASTCGNLVKVRRCRARRGAAARTAKT